MNLINKKNPQWKVLVTENGFVRDPLPSFRNDDQGNGDREKKSSFNRNDS